MAEALTNAKLRDLLVKLGFKAKDLSEQKSRAFMHPESGCELVLPENKSADVARPVDIVSIRAHLAYQGHLEDEIFDYFVEHGELPAVR